MTTTSPKKTTKRSNSEQHVNTHTLSTETDQPAIKNKANESNLQSKFRFTLASFWSSWQKIWSQKVCRQRFWSVLWAVVGIGTTIWVLFVGFPYLFSQTKVAQEYAQKKAKEAELAQRQAEIDRQLASEEPFVQGTNRRVSLLTNFGELILEMRSDAAPKNTDNFLRLVYRGYFNNTIFHRIVKQKDFAIIQGGDPTGTGYGGETAFGPQKKLPDEIWSVFPEFGFNDQGDYVVVNQPRLTSEELYKNLDLSNLYVTYPKGVVVMANTGQPDSATSQFFITLNDTILPARYTAFAVVLPESFPVLDKIYNEAEPVKINSSNSEYNPDSPVNLTPAPDGRPNKKIEIIQAKLL